MTYPEFQSLLEQVHPHCYEIAAPEGLTRFVAYAKTGGIAITGDDAVALAFDRIQLDICTQDPADSLVPLITNALDRAFIPYRVLDIGYNQSRALYVTSLQVML